MKFLLLVQIAVVASFSAPGAIPDCTKVACPAKCSCAEKSCAADLASCLADSSCTSGQACASACNCGNNSCLIKCGIMHPSIEAATLLACTEKNCPSVEVSSEAWPQILCGPDDNADDCKGLVAFNKATGSTLDWKVDGTTSLCTWSGVTCSDDTKRVTMLDLNDNRLKGYIPSEVGLLTAMTSLGLNYNHLTGSIPSEVGLLTAMTKLYLYDNGLTGSIPSEICNLQVSRYCDLSNNLFSCPLPSCPLMVACGVTCK